MPPSLQRILALGIQRARSLKDRYDSLHPIAKTLVLAWAAVNCGLFLLVLYIGPSNLAEYLVKAATAVREMQYGPLIVLSLIISTSIPPLIGNGASLTICGFAFGLDGWWIAVFGTLAGASCGFLICRRFLQFFRRQLEQFDNFNALGKAVRAKGLPLITLIRLCPIPFTYSNLFFASIESVSLWQFLIASVALTPKLLLHVWIGDRMYKFADPETRAKMDPTTRLVNAASVVAGILIGVGTGIYVYRLTLKYANQIALEGDDQSLTQLEEGGRQTEDAGEDGDMTTDELDRQLRSEGIDPSRVSVEEANNWDDQFSEFDEAEAERKSLQQSGIVEDDLATPRVEKPKPSFG